MRRSGGGARCPQQEQRYRPGSPCHRHHQHHHHRQHYHHHIVPNMIIIYRKHLGNVPSYWECFSTFCQQVKLKRSLSFLNLLHLLFQQVETKNFRFHFYFSIFYINFYFYISTLCRQVESHFFTFISQPFTSKSNLIFSISL